MPKKNERYKYKKYMIYVNRMYFVLFGTLLTSLIASVCTTEQLSFSGGGAFGAVELGILKKIRESYPIKYDRYTGISAGGLNSGFLSHFIDIDEGIREAEKMYSTIRNKDIYKLLPNTRDSLLNTHPLHKTLTEVITNLKSEPVVDTLIGTVNMYTGDLDIYKYNDNHSIEDKVLLLMCTSAIPIVFPPIKYKKYLYVDGGTLSNELLDIVHSTDYLNITYITPYGMMEENDAPISSITDMVTRTFQIVKRNYNNPFTRLNHQCDKPYGKITYYYVDSKVLKEYSMLNFDKGAELISIGYNNMKSKTFAIC
jgi:predicted acylesterase/phospholipase RssA